MTDSERQTDAESARPEDQTHTTESSTDSAPTSAQEHRDARSATFRSDGGPGSVLRERQPGFGGMDARKAAEGEPHWQAVTSDRYGHRIEPTPELDATSSSDEADDASVKLPTP